MDTRAHRPADHASLACWAWQRQSDPQTPHLTSVSFFLPKPNPKQQSSRHGRRRRDRGRRRRRKRRGRGTSIHITALDGIVNVNSLFTLAAFLGLAWRPSSDGPGLADGADPRTGNPCAAGDRAESDLVSFHVLAFACFLFSSLVALCLKQLIRTYPGHPHRRSGAGAASSSSAAVGVLGRTARINRAALRVGILASAVGSVAGCGFLMMALVNVVQVKLGRLGCGAGGAAAWAAVVPLVTLVPSAMLIYIGIVFYAFTR